MSSLDSSAEAKLIRITEKLTTIETDLKEIYQEINNLIKKNGEPNTVDTVNKLYNCHNLNEYFSIHSFGC